MEVTILCSIRNIRFILSSCLTQMLTDFNNSFTAAFSDKLQKPIIKSTTSPQICCCTTLWKLNVQPCNFRARYSVWVWCKIVNLQNLSTTYVKLCFICRLYADKFKILQHVYVLKNCLPSAFSAVSTRVSCACHCISDTLLTLQCKTFSRRCCKIL